MLNVDCLSYNNGNCMHQAAPRSFLSAASCIVAFPSKDPRFVSGCALRVGHTRPNPPPMPPKKV